MLVAQDDDDIYKVEMVDFGELSLTKINPPLSGRISDETIQLVPTSFQVIVKTKWTPTTVTQTSLFFPYLSLVFILFPRFKPFYILPEFIYFLNW